MIFEMFEPYLPFISFFIAIVANVFLIIKKVNWVLLVVGNIIIALVMGFLGLGEYNILTIMFNEILGSAEELFKAIREFIF